MFFFLLHVTFLLKAVYFLYCAFIFVLFFVCLMNVTKITYELDKYEVHRRLKDTARSANWDCSTRVKPERRWTEYIAATEPFENCKLDD